jgi:hypothetical protein
MIHVSLFIVINIQEDSEGTLCPCFFTEEEAIAAYPNDQYIEVEMDSFDINLN